MINGPEFDSFGGGKYSDVEIGKELAIQTYAVHVVEKITHPGMRNHRDLSLHPERLGASSARSHSSASRQSSLESLYRRFAGG